MILTCPQCATRYFVEADRFGAEGRQVRCSTCATSWRAEAAEALELTPTPEEPPASVDPGPLHRSFRAQVQARRRTREAVAAGVVWAVLAAGIALISLAAVLLRGQVVKIWPSTAGAYAFVRMPVNPTGFAIEDVQGGPALADGRLMVIATGQLRNVHDEARAAPPLRVSLYDNGGRRLASQLVLSPDVRVAPGDARGFKASFVDPASASHVQVEFAFDAVRRPRPATATIGLRGSAALPTLRASLPVAGATAGPAPVAAKPLPADSPYALRPIPHG